MLQATPTSLASPSLCQPVLRAKIIASVAGLAGLAVAVVLVVLAGFNNIVRVLETAGWGLFWLGPLHLVPVVLEAIALHALLSVREHVAHWPFVVWVTAVREGVNNVLPVARVGGELVGIRLLHKRGVSIALAGACTIILLTLTVMALYLLILAGIALLLSNIPSQRVTGPLIAGLLAIVPLLMLMVLVERDGRLFSWLERLISRLTGGHKLLTYWVEPAELDADIRAYYRRWRVLAVAGVWKLSSLAAEAAEVWVIMWLLAAPVPVWQAIVLESASLAARGGAFVVPAGIGVQEGSFVLVGSLLGIPAEFAISISLAKRFRELIFGVPSILSWQWYEGHLLGRHRA